MNKEEIIELIIKKENELREIDKKYKDEIAELKNQLNKINNSNNITSLTLEEKMQYLCYNTYENKGRIIQF